MVGENLVNMAFFPKTATAGLTFKVEAAPVDYPAPSWALSAFLRGPAQIDVASVASGTGHLLTVAPAATATWTPGRYSYSLRASNETTGEVFEVESGSIDVLPNLQTIADTYDGRSQAETALDAINAVLTKRATIDQQRYTINNRELWRTPIPELIKLRSFYVAQVRRERRAKTGDRTFGRRVNVRFN